MTPKEKADTLVEKHSKITTDIDRAILHAIEDVENTIEVLRTIKNTRLYNGKSLPIENELELDEQTEILNELKSRV